VLHCYDDPLVAVMLDPAHSRYSPAGHLWEAEWSGRTVAAADKRGVETLRTVRRIDAPGITREQRVEIAIRCALAVLPSGPPWAAAWRTWAERWLSGEDRSSAAAAAAAASAATSASTSAAYAYASAYDSASASAYASASASTSAYAYAYASASAYDSASAVAADDAAYSSRGGVDLDLAAICHLVVDRPVTT
jgi:hypothetical protein